MTGYRIFVLAAASCLVALDSQGQPRAETLSSEPPDSIDFVRDVRPILSDKCFQCHGPDAAAREAELRLDQEASVTMDRGGYRAINPDEPADSEVLRRIMTSDGDLRMPPAESGKPLSNDEIETIRRWIEQGAPWSTHWAYREPIRHATPSVDESNWPSHWIDNFVSKELSAVNLSPSPDADGTTLMRRLCFDLTGLPPSEDRVDRYMNDHGEIVHYEQLVNELLSSDAYGERMAMYWLDLVRYADTVGYHGDQDHSISPYRDYVIDAFTRNLPFDQFTVEQLAGDLLPDATIDQKIASGYNRLLQTSHEGGVQPAEYLAIYAADRVRNVSAVWLASTMGCAQCHDHKYDPFTMRDFYSMVAFFADIDEARHFRKGTNSLPTARPPEIEVLSRRSRQKVNRLRERISQLEQEISRADDSADIETIQTELTANQRLLKELVGSKRRTMITVAIEPREIRILPRGNWLDKSGEVVGPAVPNFLGKIDTDKRPTRQDLARWLTDSEDGIGLLTARVFVNRFWYLLFGQGLASILDDFGGQGQPPTHPRLLDRLAHEFVESGWDVKHMMRLLVMSHTYRQSSLETEEHRRIDPENLLFSRQSRFRLPAEMIRDSALSISGLLVREVGGASVKPYQPEGYYRHLNFPKRRYKASDDSGQWRRGVYVHWQRQFLHPMLRAFDAPSREECTAKRPRSNTPVAALVLLNDPTFIEAARGLAMRILRQPHDSPAARIDWAFRQALTRRPDEAERRMLLELFESNYEMYQSSPKAAEQLLSVGIAPSSKNVNATELAAWTSVARTIFNLNEAIYRN